MSDCTKIPTSAEVYSVIFARHLDQLVVYASFSDPTGTWMGGPGDTGRMETVWAFKGADWPILEAKTTWTIDPAKPSHERINERHEYWLLMSKKED